MAELLIVETELPTTMEVETNPQTVEISEPMQTLEITVTELLVVQS